MSPRRAVFLVALALAGLAPAAEVDPALGWAYTQEGPRLAPGMYHVEGSPLAPLSSDQLEAMAVPPDWLPDLHPPPPFIVVQKRGKGIDACAECHQIAGSGFLGTAGLAGLPANYIVEQVREFRSGRRASSQVNRSEVAEMISEARHVSDADLSEAAAYFASVRHRRWVEVVETDAVPRTLVGRYDWRYLDPRGGTEPIDGRIVEVARDVTAMLEGDPRVVTTDFVPPGSLSRGASLARRPNALGQVCATCHGESLQGTPLAPPLAGNFASYLARTLWDIKSGARAGPAVALMQPVVAALTARDITDVSAYIASLAPAPGPAPSLASTQAQATSQPK